MPITAERFESIIHAAYDAQDRIVAIKNQVHFHEAAILGAGEQCREAALDLVDMIKNQAQVGDEELRTVAAERAHFNANKRKNRRAKLATRRWRQRRRALDGNSERDRESEEPNAAEMPNTDDPLGASLPEGWNNQPIATGFRRKSGSGDPSVGGS